MSRIKKITRPYAWESLQARIDESIITKQPMIERPFWYEHVDSGQMYHDLYGCVGWPTESTDKLQGMPGYCAVVGVVKSKTDKPVRDAGFRIMGEGESGDIPTLLQKMLELRQEWGFGLHPDLLQAWLGDPERFIMTIALLNERLMLKGGDKMAILISPPDDCDEPKAFDTYKRSLESVIVSNPVRFAFGGNDILKNKLREFRRNDPAVFAVGGLVHSLLVRCTWMDQTRENMFVVEEGEERAA
jgi:hypothetical protein